MTVTILIFDTTTILIYYSKNYCELDPLISRESTLSSYQFLLFPHYTVKSKRLLISTFTHTHTFRFHGWCRVIKPLQSSADKQTAKIVSKSRYRCDSGAEEDGKRSEEK